MDKLIHRVGEIKKLDDQISRLRTERELMVQELEGMTRNGSTTKAKPPPKAHQRSMKRTRHTNSRAEIIRLLGERGEATCAELSEILGRKVNSTITIMARVGQVKSVRRGYYALPNYGVSEVPPSAPQPQTAGTPQGC